MSSGRSIAEAGRQRENSCIQLQKPAIRQIYGCWQVNSCISRNRWRESSCHGWHYDRLLPFISPLGCDSSDSAGFCCAQEDLNRSFTLKTTSGRGKRASCFDCTRWCGTAMIYVIATLNTRGKTTASQVLSLICSGVWTCRKQSQ